MANNLPSHGLQSGDERRAPLFSISGSESDSSKDKELVSLWQAGVILDIAAEKPKKTPTSVATKLVRLGLFDDRAAVNVENEKRGGKSIADLEHDGAYTIYISRDPNTQAPFYVGQSQNFRKRTKANVRRFSKLLSGQRAIIEVVETVATYALARAGERALITNLTNDGCILLNVLDREEIGLLSIPPP